MRTATEIAIWRTKRTAKRLVDAGASVTGSRLGSYDALEAIEEELGSDHFTGVVISTLPPGLSSWLHLDLPSKMKTRWPGLEVIHVITPSAFFRQDDAAVTQRTVRSG
jgi:hypothetical protein